ncbi:anti-sigma-28 factor, FlgM family [Clostridium collagenovorans DSM 3089]|uniref:Negative regulator of flagellin synthesis n=1 Tax=Clostridium collagenovorans DSM 3089 TaxID=1121306 RepID=A0A1M5WNZ1_9CLOT|nr:flagellar biosynthesis anti-sigma factor FlgM [Clostridium collagenovorans]SHH89286.1 anti-sigma-28 factor, FlgM family [Clostridium collagenovorans DSM 3089]
MKVDCIQRNTMINAYNRQRQPLKQEEMIKQNKDKVIISEDAKQLSKLNSDNENINIDKINEIKNRIKQGTYSVSSKDIAKKIIEVTKGE